MMQPASPAPQSPRKIGSALAMFENAIKKNRENGAEGSKSLVPGLAKSLVASPLKVKRTLLSSLPTEDAVDKATTPDSVETPKMSNKQQHRETYSPIRRPPLLDISEEGSSHLVGSETREGTKTSAATFSSTHTVPASPESPETPNLIPIEDALQGGNPSFRGMITEGGTRDVMPSQPPSRPRRLYDSPSLLYQKEPVPQAPLSAAKLGVDNRPPSRSPLRAPSQPSSRPQKIHSSASLLFQREPTQIKKEISREEQKSTPAVEEVASVYFPASPLKVQRLNYVQYSCVSPTGTCSTTSMTSEETNSSKESQSRSRQRIVNNLLSASQVLNSDSDSDSDEADHALLSPQSETNSVVCKPRRVVRCSNDSTNSSSSGTSATNSTRESSSDGSFDTPPGRSILRSSTRKKLAGSRKTVAIEQSFEYSSDVMVTPKKKSTRLIRIRKADADADQASLLQSPVKVSKKKDKSSRLSRSNSRSLSPDNHDDAPCHPFQSLSPTKTRNVASLAPSPTPISILRVSGAGPLPDAPFKGASRKMIEHWKEQDSARSLHSTSSLRLPLKPDLNSSMKSLKRGLRVTFADQVPRKQRSMMTLCLKDSTPKQPRRNSMSDMDDVKKSPTFLQDPLLLERRAHRKATQIQDWWCQKLSIIGFAKIIAVTKMQALYRGARQRMLCRIAVLEATITQIATKRQRDLLKIQAKKWKVMEAIKKEADKEAAEEENRRASEVTATDKVIEQLERENGKIRDQNKKIGEACHLLKVMNDQIEQTLMIHNDNFATMRETVGIMNERNARSIRTKEKYEKRIAKVQEKVATSAKCGDYANAVRKNTEQSTTDIVESFKDRSDDEKFVAQLVIMGALSSIDEQEEESSSSEASEEADKQFGFDLSFRVSDEISIWSDVSSFRALEDVLAPLNNSRHSRDTSGEELSIEGGGDSDSDQSTIFVDTSAINMN